MKIIKKMAMQHLLVDSLVWPIFLSLNVKLIAFQIRP